MRGTGRNSPREDFLRFERVNQEIMGDDMKDMIRNNPADVVYGAFSEKFHRGMIRVFQRDAEMQKYCHARPRSAKAGNATFFQAGTKNSFGRIARVVFRSLLPRRCRVVSGVRCAN